MQCILGLNKYFICHKKRYLMNSIQSVMLVNIQNYSLFNFCETPRIPMWQVCVREMSLLDEILNVRLYADKHHNIKYIYKYNQFRANVKSLINKYTTYRVMAHLSNGSMFRTPCRFPSIIYSILLILNK